MNSPDVIDELASEMQRQGLIALNDDELHINPARSRTLQLLAAGARETLQRYAITFWLLSANPSINRGTLEKESRTVAQRLSVLHGINAPEFFDKAVFSSLVLTLRDEGYHQRYRRCRTGRDDENLSDVGRTGHVRCASDHRERHTRRVSIKKTGRNEMTGFLFCRLSQTQKCQ